MEIFDEEFHNNLNAEPQQTVLNDTKHYKDWPDFTKKCFSECSSKQWRILSSFFLLSTWRNFAQFQRANSSFLSSTFSIYLTFIHSYSYRSLFSSLFISVKLLFMPNMEQFLTQSCQKCEKCCRIQRCDRHVALDEIIFAIPRPFRISNRDLHFRILRTHSVSKPCSLQLCTQCNLK